MRRDLLTRKNTHGFRLPGLINPSDAPVGTQLWQNITFSQKEEPPVPSFSAISETGPRLSTWRLEGCYLNAGPATSAFHLNASTDAGSISTSFPVTVNHSAAGGSINADVGTTPQATVILKTNAGSITLNKGS